MFSVIIPLYNKAHTIRRCLDSVLAQSFEDFEIVIVNDGSSDSSEEVVQGNYQDPRIVIHTQPNAGVSAARNAGVALAKNAHVAFLDADDEWHPDFLSTMKRAIEAYPEAGLLGSGSIHRDWNDASGQDWTLERYRGQIQVVDYFQNPHTMPHTSAMVASRKAFFEVFPDGEGFPVGAKLCEDWSCFYRLAARFPFVYVGLPLGYRNNGVPGQITGGAGDNRRKLMHHILNFYNRMASDPMVSIRRQYVKFMRYDIRCELLRNIRAGDYEMLEIIFGGLEAVATRHLNHMDRKCSRIRSMRIPMVAYLYWTKLVWRCQGYPVVGKFR